MRADTYPTTGGIIMTIPLNQTFYPYKADEESYILFKSNDHNRGHDGADSGLPVPPQGLWEGYGNTAEEFLLWGKHNVITMRQILESSGFHIRSGGRVLDFGCASGRMIRWLADIADRCEVWVSTLMRTISFGARSI